MIPGVPVVSPGGGGYRITFPIAKDDTCLLVFADGSLDRWLSGDGKEVDPEFDHAHGPMAAVAIIGLRPFGAALSSAPTDEMSIGKDKDGGTITIKDGAITITATGSGKIKLEIGSGTIELGGTASKLIKDTFVDDVKALVAQTLATILQGGTAGSPVKQQIVLASQISSATVSSGQYTNDKVKHGA